MIFNKRRVSPTTTFSSSTEVPNSNNRRHRRYLACMYNYLISVKAAFQEYNTYKNGYDPYQMKQYADESKFDPYHQVNQSDMDKILSSSSSSSASDDDTMIEQEEQKPLPPTKRLRTMASSVMDHATQALLYGTFAAFNFVWSEKKNLEEYCFQQNKSVSFDFSIQAQEPPKKKQKVEFRGFGIDFCPLIERPAALQSRMDNAERNLRDICLKTKESVHDAVVNKTIHSYGGLTVPSKRTFDDTWGFVDDNDLSVQFKVKYKLSFIALVVAY